MRRKHRILPDLFCTLQFREHDIQHSPFAIQSSNYLLLSLLSAQFASILFYTTQIIVAHNSYSHYPTIK